MLPGLKKKAQTDKTAAVLTVGQIFIQPQTFLKLSVSHF